MKGNGEYTSFEDAARDMDRQFELRDKVLLSIAEDVRTLTTNVTRLVESNIRKEEREARQKEINTEVDKQLKELQQFKQDILIARASEFHVMNFLKSKYPFIVIAVLIAAYELSQFLSI